MKKIFIKETNQNKTPEYIIYLMLWPDRKILKAFVETSEKDKEMRVHELFVEHFMSDESPTKTITIEDILIKSIS
jgi:hypothetical protein